MANEKKYGSLRPLHCVWGGGGGYKYAFVNFYVFRDMKK